MAASLNQRYGRDHVTVVLTRFDERSIISEQDAAKAIGNPIAFRFPSDYRLALDALNQGTPVVMENGSRLSDAFKRFGRNLAGLKAETEERQPTGLLGRLAGRR
jgi:pilus assembly protein CpaE